MMASPSGPLLNYLPAIYHTSEDLRQLLAVFEAVLFGVDGKEPRQERGQQSISELLPIVDNIATIASLFDAYETPKELVPWLAQWVALSHLSGLTEQRQRELLAEIVPLYAQRGTQTYLEKLLEFFKPENTRIVIEDRELHGFVVGTARIGIDSRLGYDRPFWFIVRVYPPTPVSAINEQRRFITQWEERLRRVIDFAKPAHTLYELDWQFEDRAKSIE
jgi:phage tail-like protein